MAKCHMTCFSSSSLRDSPWPREPESEVLRPFERAVDLWLDDGCQCWRKQRRTVAEVYPCKHATSSSVDRSVRPWPSHARFKLCPVRLEGPDAYLGDFIAH